MQITIRPSEVVNLFDPVPDGLYRVRITEFADKEGDKGPWCVTSLLICEGEFAEARQLSDNWMFMDSGLWRTLPKLSAFAGRDISDDEEFVFDSDEFIGLEAMVTTKQVTYPKKDGSGDGIRSEVVEYYPTDDSPVGSSI
jgi:hypothetical protein